MADRPSHTPEALLSAYIEVRLAQAPHSVFVPSDLAIKTSLRFRDMMKVHVNSTEPNVQSGFFEWWRRLWPRFEWVSLNVERQHPSTSCDGQPHIVLQFSPQIWAIYQMYLYHNALDLREHIVVQNDATMLSTLEILTKLQALGIELHDAVFRNLVTAITYNFFQYGPISGFVMRTLLSNEFERGIASSRLANILTDIFKAYPNFERSDVDDASERPHYDDYGFLHLMADIVVINYKGLLQHKRFFTNFHDHGYVYCFIMKKVLAELVSCSTKIHRPLDNYLLAGDNIDQDETRQAVNRLRRSPSQSSLWCPSYPCSPSDLLLQQAEERRRQERSSFPSSSAALGGQLYRQKSHQSMDQTLDYFPHSDVGGKRKRSMIETEDDETRLNDSTCRRSRLS